MGEIKAKGLCLRSMDYADNDKLCTVYLLEFGKVLIKFRGVKKPKAKLAFAAAPLCLGEYIINEKMGYHTCINCSMITSFMPLWHDLNKFYPSMSAIELLDKFTRDGQQSDDLCIIVINFLDILTTSNNPIVDYAKFLYEFAVVSGYGLSRDSLRRERIVCSASGLEIIDRLRLSQDVSDCKVNNLLAAATTMIEYLSLTCEQKLVASKQCVEYLISVL